MTQFAGMSSCAQFAGSQLKIALRVVSVAVLLPASGWAAITPTGNVSPGYPGGVDPWNVGAELRVGYSAAGSLAVNGGSDITSAGGTIGFDPGVVGTISLTGSGTTWTNSQNLFVGVFGSGRLDVLQGAYVQNAQASLGHIDGTADVHVEGARSTWFSGGELVVGNGHQATLTIEDQGGVISGATWIGLNSQSSGSVVIDGPGSAWTVLQSLSLGDVEDSGAATLSLTGAGSRLYVGASAVQDGGQFPNNETALVVSAAGGTAQLAIYAGNTLMNAGNGYVGVGAGEAGEVTIDGAASAWHNTGTVQIGAAGTATLKLISGGTVSAGGNLTIGSLGTLAGNGTAAATVLNTGTVSPGLSAGSLTVTGDYAQSASGALVVELFGTGAGQFDRLQVSGTASLGGELEVVLGSNGGNPFAPQMGATFTFLTAVQGRMGTFSLADLPGLPAGQMWQVRYAAAATTLAVTRAGDYNDDGVVNAADYVVWRRLLGSSYDPRADGDTNGVINAADYAVWRANFGAVAAASSLGGVAGAGAAVPEPQTVGGVVVALMLTQVLRPLRRRHVARQSRSA